MQKSKARQANTESGNSNGKREKNILNYNQENKKSQTSYMKRQLKKENFVLYSSLIRGAPYCSSTYLSSPCKFLHFYITQSTLDMDSTCHLSKQNTGI